MPDQGKNTPARFVAITGLLVLFIAAIAIIATTEGSKDTSEDEGPGGTGGNITAAKTSKPDKEIETAIERGEYVVEAGDSLTSISVATGIDIETLEQLNPGIDPQQLQEGARIRLK